MRTLLFIIFAVNAQPILVQDGFSTTDQCAVSGERIISHDGWYMGAHETKPIKYACIRIDPARIPSDEEVQRSMRKPHDQRSD